MALKRSDVLITRPCGMEVYRRYRATGLGWGFLPEPDRRGLPPDEEMMRDVDEAHRCGVKFQGRVELDADWMGMIDYDSNFMESTVRDLNDKPAVTWWTHTYKGHPSYHFCTNSPGYRHYLVYQLRRVMEAGADWLMIDSAIPTIGALNARYGGCFCRYCMAGFRDYLKQNLDLAASKDPITDDLASFNYRDYLLAHGYSDKRYRAEILAFPPTVPLAREYFNYQWREVNALFRCFKRYAQYFGADVPMSSNSPYYWAEFMYAVDAHDFYTNEMEYQPPENEVLLRSRFILSSSLTPWASWWRLRACPAPSNPIDSAIAPGISGFGSPKPTRTGTSLWRRTKCGRAATPASPTAGIIASPAITKTSTISCATIPICSTATNPWPRSH